MPARVHAERPEHTPGLRGYRPGEQTAGFTFWGNVVTRNLCLIGLLLLVTACAQPARTSQMIYHPSETQQAEVPDAVRDGITIASVSGGEETNPLWTSQVGDAEFREALLVTLQELQLSAFGDDAPYALTVNLLGLEQPLIGFDATVTCTANYLVVATADGSEVFNETFKTPYTADFSDAIIGIERLRLANEGAARANIQAFIARFLEVAEEL